MNESRQKAKELYDRETTGTEFDRREGDAYPLKKFHNQIKGLLLEEFASHKGRLLDLACGRGGDIFKWIEKKISYVEGYDIAPLEIKEAKRRWEEAKRKRRDIRTEAEFKVTGELGVSPITFTPLFDVCTCMFAAHYFFATETSAWRFFETVSGSLREGGYFFGTMPSGRKILEVLNRQDKLDLPMLKIEKKSDGDFFGKPPPFGGAFTFSITDTVTEAKSFEYLVFEGVCKAVAEKYHLIPVTNFVSPKLRGCFDPQDVAPGSTKLFKHFFPTAADFEKCDPSLRLASSLNVAFCFQKVSPPGSLQPSRPILPQQRDGPQNLLNNSRDSGVEDRYDREEKKLMQRMQTAAGGSRPTSAVQAQQVEKLRQQREVQHGLKRSTEEAEKPPPKKPRTDQDILDDIGL